MEARNDIDPPRGRSRQALGYAVQQRIVRERVPKTIGQENDVEFGLGLVTRTGKQVQDVDWVSAPYVALDIRLASGSLMGIGLKIGSQLVSQRTLVVVRDDYLQIRSGLLMEWFDMRMEGD